MSVWRIAPVTLAAILATTLAACASEEGSQGRGPVGPAASEGLPPSQPWVYDDYQYRLTPGDEVALHFVVESDLNANVVIGPDGRGVFPLISSVYVAGMTVDQANQALTQAYARVLRNPQVQALVATYGASQIYVAGEVKTPGVTQIKGQINVAQAIFAAGGFMETARTTKVVVLRRRPDGVLLTTTVDVKRLINGDPAGDFLVHPGDLIFVPRSNVVEANLFIRQYLNGLLPFNFGLSYDLSRPLK